MTIANRDLAAEARAWLTDTLNGDPRGTLTELRVARNLVAELADEVGRRVVRLAAAQADLDTVRAHIDQRPEYITAIEGGGAEDDIWRWRGGAEARRQLAENLSWTTPYKPGEKTAPKEARDGE